MKGTKEFYELMESFENTAKHIVRAGSQGFKREPKENFKNGWYYSDGNVNEFFRVYMAGYSYGKSCFIN